MNHDRWFARPRLSRRDAHLIEAFLIGLAVILISVSFIVSSGVVAKALRAGALFEFGCAYLVTVSIRIIDTYKLWPGAGLAASEPQPLQRTWRSIAAEYAFLFGVGILGTVTFCWLAF